MRYLFIYKLFVYQEIKIHQIGHSLSVDLTVIQDIASDGCFSLGMVARFEAALRETGAWMYPRLFWESGVLGQVLYLESHAVGVSATGIGCYFDDAGMPSFQSINNGCAPFGFLVSHRNGVLSLTLSL